MLNKIILMGRLTRDPELRRTGNGEGLRTLVANDTGVKDSHLDICVGSHYEAEQLGLRTATVYWCEEVS